MKYIKKFESKIEEGDTLNIDDYIYVKHSAKNDYGEIIITANKPYKVKYIYSSRRDFTIIGDNGEEIEIEYNKYIYIISKEDAERYFDSEKYNL